MYLKKYNSLYILMVCLKYCQLLDNEFVLMLNVFIT